jgi:glycosyltransferase involved in cell wall biosynthesis
MTPKISIIIPCFNDSRYIEQAVESALNQTYPNKEVILVDDGSNAQTKSVLKSIEPKITKLITQHNQGQSAARNNGINLAKGEYVIVLDSDDYFEPAFCEKAFSIINSLQDIKLITCYTTLIFEDKSSRRYIPRGGTLRDFLPSNSAVGGVLFKKKDWERVGGYDEEMRNGFEDWEFFIRILKGGGFTQVIQEPLYNYRRRNNSTTNIANSKKYELLTYIYTKHKALYMDNFEGFVAHLLNKIAFEEKQHKKLLIQKEYRIGYLLLYPARIVKCFFKSIFK